jgi:hypothetical protein
LNPLLRNGLILSGLAVIVGLMLVYAHWFFGADLQQPAYLLPFIFLLQILVHWIGLRHEDPTGHLAVALMISNALLFVALILRWDRFDVPEWSLITAVIPRGAWHHSPGPPDWWPLTIYLREGAQWPNMVLFLPVVGTWIAIGWLIHQGHHQSVADERSDAA